MKRDRFVKYILPLTVLIVILSFISTAEATFTVDRQLIELEAVPGKAIVGEIGISNLLDTEQTIVIRPVDYTRDSRENVTTVDPGTIGNSLYPYIELSANQITLQPGETATVTYSVKIPEGVEGSRWLAIYFEPLDFDRPEDETVDEEAEDAGEVEIVYDKAQFEIIFQIRYRTLIVVNVKGTENPSGRVTGLTKIDDKGKAFEIEFENTGNSCYRAQGWLEIRNINGSTVATIPINRKFIFPGEKLLITASDNNLDLSPGKYLALAVFDYGGDRLVAGQLVFTVE